MKDDPRVLFAFSTKRSKSLASFLRTLKLNARDLIQAEQVHGRSAKIVGLGDKGKTVPNCDALVTKEKKLPLAIRTADCLPILISDEKTPAIALVHAGWRGTAKKIATAALKKMAAAFGTRAKNCMIFMGPSIEGKCYDVDLKALNRSELLSLGVKAKNIFMSDRCTFCEKGLYHSYRRDRTDKRNFSIAMLK